jgi:ribosomal protein S18 acetylase RimI-like enzyme
MADKAKTLGKSCIALDVNSTSPAVRFYERNGFHTLIETRLPDLDAQGVPPSYRMMKQI